jgi:hypothetical protein
VEVLGGKQHLEWPGRSRQDYEHVPSYPNPISDWRKKKRKHFILGQLVSCIHSTLIFHILHHEVLKQLFFTMELDAIHTYIHLVRVLQVTRKCCLLSAEKKSTLYGFTIGNVLTGSEESMFQTCNFMQRRNCHDILYEVLTLNRQFWAIMTLVPEFVLCSVSG